MRNISTPGILSFAARVDLVIESISPGLAVGDMDRDGKPDLVLTNWESNTVDVFRNTSNQGSISFAEKRSFITDSGPVAVAVGDLDGDGMLELVATIPDNSAVSI